MKGIIAIWSGAVVDIPYGWKLCDGSNGTPDLRDQFVYSAGPLKPTGSTGGKNSHWHTNNHGSHTHDLPPGVDIAAGVGYSHLIGSTLISDNTGSCYDWPPYYSLCYIMHI